MSFRRTRGPFSPPHPTRSVPPISFMRRQRRNHRCALQKWFGKARPASRAFLLTLPLPAFDGWKGNMLIYHLPVPGNRSATSLSHALAVSHRPLYAVALNNHGTLPVAPFVSMLRASFVRFPFRSLRERREACNTRRLGARSCRFPC